MGNLVITIGRENGSGGRYVGEKLAEKLGIKCYDSELVAQTAAAAKNKFSDKYVEGHDEKCSSGMLYFGGLAIQDDLFNEQAKVIRSLAERESCVIVGRASNYVLRGHDNLINVFIKAPAEARIARVCERENISYAAAKREIMNRDRQRAGFYRFYTNSNWGDCRNYHICLDTDCCGISGAVELIAEFIKMHDSDTVMTE